MLRTTFPIEDIAWKKEVERMLSGLSVGMRQIAQQATPILSSGVVIGGVVPDPKQCMQFDFTVEPGATSDCLGCTSDCKTLHVSSDITFQFDGDPSPTVVFPAGDYELKRFGAVNDCIWRREPDPDDPHGAYVHFDAFGDSGDGSGHNTAVTFQLGGTYSLYYATATGSPSCTTGTEPRSIGRRWAGKSADRWPGPAGRIGSRPWRMAT